MTQNVLLYSTLIVKNRAKWVLFCLTSNTLLLYVITELSYCHAGNMGFIFLKKKFNLRKVIYVIMKFFR